MADGGQADTLFYKLTHACGCMYFTERVSARPPVSLVLGAKKDELLMEYALAGIDNHLFTARYQLYLPNKAELQEQLNLLMKN